MNGQWLVWLRAALLLGYAVACTALALVAARGAWRRNLDFGGVRGWYPRALPRQLRGVSAAVVGGLIAFGVGGYAAAMWLVLLNVIQNYP